MIGWVLASCGVHEYRSRSPVICPCIARTVHHFATTEPVNPWAGALNSDDDRKADEDYGSRRPDKRARRRVTRGVVFCNLPIKNDQPDGPRCNLWKSHPGRCTWAR